MKRTASLLVFLFSCNLFMIAQDLQITGKITSADDGSSLPGVSIVVKGTTIGTISGVDGTFTLSAPSEATLIFSFVGMKTIEEEVANRTSIDVVMSSEVTGLDEVVVTALGISREQKSLGYSVQKVSGEDVSTVKNDNLVNSFAGKVAGVTVRTNTNMGGSSDIVIRGHSSLTQDNQALFVVDGVPISNSNTNNDGQLEGRAGYDYGNAASDINPNDIESVSILKGAAATALYGSRAANGVILITTKKGGASETGKKVGINFSSNLTVGIMDKSTFPTYQQEYGAGYGPYYSDDADYPGMEVEDVFDDGSTDYMPPYYEDASRGQKFDENLLVYQWDAFHPSSPNYMTKTPWVAGAHGPDYFFNPSVSYTNSIDISGGDEKTTYRLSYTNLNSTGILPNSSLKRNNFTFNGSHKVTDRLKISSSANYINTRGKGRNSTGYSDNILSSFRQWYQVNVDMKMQEEMYNKTKENVTWNPTYWDDDTPAYWDNPYWVRYENYETDERNRLIGYIQADYTLTDYLSFMARTSIDTYSELQEERKAAGSVSGEFGVDRTEVTSGYSRLTRSFHELNVDFMANFHKKLTSTLDLTALIGTNIRRSKEDKVFASTNNGLAVAGLYALSNSVDQMLPPEEDLYEIGVNGIFGSVSLGIANMVFIDGTLRNDVSSTLPSDNNSYMYPSVSTSFLFSNLVDANWLSLGKIRLNYAEVGSSAPALSIKDTYEQNTPFSGTTLATVPKTKNNSDLKPERSKSYEGGLAMNFLQSRVGFDLALYKTNTIDQLLPVSVSYATGYEKKWVNAGEIENKGIELTLFGDVVRMSSFNWNVSLNWSKNTNKVIELYEDESGNQVQNLQLADLQGGVTINAMVGESYGTIHGSDYVYDEATGKRIIESNGHYKISDDNDIVIGNFNPDWTAGLRNSFSYKNLKFSFLIDWQKGGDVFSLDLWYGIATGLYEETVGNNDLGNPKRDPIDYVDQENNDPAMGYTSASGGTIFPGVLEDGTENYIRVAQNNYRGDGYYYSPNKRYVYDASFVKLREVTLSYQLPRDLFDNTFIYSASVGFVGSNLWIIHKNLPYADPEASQGSGNIQGWQSGVMPSTRNFGFTVNLQF